MSLGQDGAYSERSLIATDRRREYIRPLYAYLREHFYIAGLVLGEAGHRQDYPMTPVRVAQVKRGELVIPPWLVAESCAVIGKSVAEVMGANWRARFGDDGRGGSEIAPVGTPRLYSKDKLPASAGSTDSTDSTESSESVA